MMLGASTPKTPQLGQCHQDSANRDVEDFCAWARDQGVARPGLDPGPQSFYFNPNADQILQFKHDPYDANSLADDIVIDIICSADEKTLWVTTADGTLHRVDANSFEINRIKEGSYSDWPKGINISRLAQDGTIWLGGVSPEGELYLSSYDPNTEEVITYPLTQMGATSADQ
ncbi:MAG: hypothetical protein AAF909_14345, partial [Pseudomonadota bacterium]